MRTDTARKHTGISFVLFDMASPGVSTRPILLISGKSPFLASSVVAVTALRAGGSAAQQRCRLPRLAGARAVATLAVDEGAKHRPAQTRSRATAGGDGFVLDGAKALVIDGPVAELLIVAARSQGAPGATGGITPFLVERTVEYLLMKRARVLQEFFGDANFHVDALASARGY